MAHIIDSRRVTDLAIISGYREALKSYDKITELRKKTDSLILNSHTIIQQNRVDPSGKMVPQVIKVKALCRAENPMPYRVRRLRLSSRLR